MDTLKLLLSEVKKLNATLDRWAPSEKPVPDFPRETAFRWIGGEHPGQGYLTSLPQKGDASWQTLRGLTVKRMSSTSTHASFSKGIPPIMPSFGAPEAPENRPSSKPFLLSIEKKASE